MESVMVSPSSPMPVSPLKARGGHVAVKGSGLAGAGKFRLPCCADIRIEALRALVGVSGVKAHTGGVHVVKLKPVARGQRLVRALDPGPDVLAADIKFMLIRDVPDVAHSAVQGAAVPMSNLAMRPPASFRSFK